MDLLLRVWQGETIDWKKIEKEYMPSKVCAQCGYMKKMQLYSTTEWKRVDSNDDFLGNCMMCYAQHKADQRPWQCTRCFQWREETAFPEKKRTAHSNHNRVCYNCVEMRKCKVCQIEKNRLQFTESEWTHI